jgi:hypothetical protein
MNWKRQDLEGNTYDLIELLFLVETKAKDKNFRMEIRTRNLAMENMGIKTTENLFRLDNKARLCIT